MITQWLIHAKGPPRSCPTRLASPSPLPATSGASHTRLNVTVTTTPAWIPAHPFHAVPTTTLPSVAMGSPSIRSRGTHISVAMHTAGPLSASSHDTSMGRTHSVSPAGSREHSRVRRDPEFEISLFRTVESGILETVNATSEHDRMVAVADLVYERLLRNGFVVPSSAANSTSFVNATLATAPSEFHNLQGSSPPSDFALLLAAVNRGTQATENLTRIILQRLGDAPASTHQSQESRAGAGGDAMSM